MIDIRILINNLENGPVILQNLLSPIPGKLIKSCRIGKKWSIHEHACHIVQTEEVLLNRFQRFQDEEMPYFESYCADKTMPCDNLPKLNLDIELNKLFSMRKKMISLIRGFEEPVWNKRAIHDQYKVYNPYILLRHTLVHEHFHMYRIEELWLTKDEFIS